MRLINNFIALYLLENKDELEQVLDNIDNIKKSMPSYSWVEEINKHEIYHIFYENYNKSIMVIDTMLHYIHLKDYTLRNKCYIFIAYYLNVTINFFTGILSPPNDSTSYNLVSSLIQNNNLTLEKATINFTNGCSNKSKLNGANKEAIYISFLKIDDEIDNKNIKKLLKIFPNGYMEI